MVNYRTKVVYTEGDPLYRDGFRVEFAKPRGFGYDATVHDGLTEVEALELAANLITEIRRANIAALLNEEK